HVYGGFAGTETQLSERDWVANVTILDGQADGRVVTVSAGHEISTIDGFTIRNGSSPNGGGIYCLYAAPTIANNTITGNSSYYGGGIYCYYASPTIDNNTITGNSASYYGGGVYCSYASPTIANNTITGNFVLFNGGGGIYCSSSSPTIANNTITGNHGGYRGGGIYSGSDCSPTIANNTITENSASSSGGGIYCGGSSPTIANTIVAFNSSGIYKEGSGTPVLRYNCVYGNTAYNYSGLTDPTGTGGNISTDPLFVQTPSPGPDSVWGTADDEPGDVHLLADSPCVDAGDNAYAIGDYDLDGNPRVVDGDADDVAVVDMGAYEYEYSPVIGAADFDADGDVDLADFAQFARCFGGPENPPASQCEVDADLDNDDDVDADDFVIFEQNLAASGPSA
ncbi:MAG: right-handed parallel beta-helix repeat-containing protein, partial [Phycisphaerae bacterium]|nr:right-handed parallel beta-helix repeat-containing protein [Phycisphaerae bacterium]